MSKKYCALPDYDQLNPIQDTRLTYPGTLDGCTNSNPAEAKDDQSLTVQPSLEAEFEVYGDRFNSEHFSQVESQLLLLDEEAFAKKYFPQYLNQICNQPNLNPTSIGEPIPSGYQTKLELSLEPCLPIQQFILEVDEVRLAIAKNTFPKRIYQGSSGSYFCYKLDGGGGIPQGRLGIGKGPRLVGVFKPKDEEPYGNLNPKWTKWLHKNLFPCCFGYLSEVSASLVDRQLQLGLVPRTEVVNLASPTFHYRSKVRNDYLNHKKLLPPKVGSFQMFLVGYVNASTFLTEHPWPQSCVLSGSQPDSPQVGGGGEVDWNLGSTHLPPNQKLNHSLLSDTFWSPQRQKSFRLQIEKLVIFDYLIRNTDRGLDNWMIKATQDGISVKAIDHGLAFPHKHPDNWRSYPYGWLYLPPSLLHHPFAQTTRNYFLTKLTHPQFWVQLESQLTHLNRLDPHFNQALFEGQLQVLRGQAYNILLSLQHPHHGPMDLCKRNQVVVLEVPHQLNSTSIPLADLHQSNPSGSSNSVWPDPFFQQQVSTDTSTKKKVIRKLKTLSKQPCFSFC